MGEKYYPFGNQAAAGSRNGEMSDREPLPLPMIPPLFQAIERIQTLNYRLLEIGAKLENHADRLFGCGVSDTIRDDDRTAQVEPSAIMDRLFVVLDNIDRTANALELEAIRNCSVV